MKIIIEKPPFYTEVIKRFKIDETITIYAYGDIIYNPANIEISDHILTHEKTHQYQQKAIGKDLWWQKYFDDPVFRVDQEIEAYQRQYRHICKLTKDKEERNRILNQMGEIMSGEMYGNVIRKSEAVKRIKQI